MLCLIVNQKAIRGSLNPLKSGSQCERNGIVKSVPARFALPCLKRFETLKHSVRLLAVAIDPSI